MPPQCTLFDRIAYYLAKSNVKCIWFKNTSSNILCPPIKSKHSYTYPGSKYIHESWQRLMDDPILFHSNLKCNSSCRKCDKNTALFFCLWNEKALRPFPMVGAVKSHWIFFPKLRGASYPFQHWQPQAPLPPPQGWEPSSTNTLWCYWNTWCFQLESPYNDERQTR